MGTGYHGGFGHTKGSEKYINKSLHNLISRCIMGDKKSILSEVKIIFRDEVFFREI